MKSSKNERHWLLRFGSDDVFVAAGLLTFAGAGYALGSAWVGLVVPAAVLLVLGLAPLRRLF